MNVALPIALSALLLAGCSAGVGNGAHFLAAGSPVGDYILPVASLQESRFAGVIRQRYDFSCGSAALATLLRYHYDFDVAEEDAFRGMWASGNREHIRQVGFSLLEMKRWLASRGLAADGYEVPLDQVEKAGIPGIALISINGYRHFVVLKGVRGQEVLLGDPSLGLTIVPRDEFERAWNGIFFVISDDQERARRSFGPDRQWAAFARAPIASALADPVSQQALMLTAPFYRDIS
jgi:predicted double-glycine peptidase